MYRPHEAREDTVLFPAFRGIVSAHEFDALGEEFEKKEDQLFGDEGFFKVVGQVAELEKKLGIFEFGPVHSEIGERRFCWLRVREQETTSSPVTCTIGRVQRVEEVVYTATIYGDNSGRPASFRA